MKQALAQKAEAERRAQALEAELPALPAADAARPVTSPVTPRLRHERPGRAAVRAVRRRARPLYGLPAGVGALGPRRRRSRRPAPDVGARPHGQRTAKRSSRRACRPGRTAYPDFDTVLTEADTLGLQVSAVMQDAIADVPAGGRPRVLPRDASRGVHAARRGVAIHSRCCCPCDAPAPREPIWPRVPAPSNGDRHSRTGSGQYREAPRDAGGELACRVRRAAGRYGVRWPSTRGTGTAGSKFQAPAKSRPARPVCDARRAEGRDGEYVHHPDLGAQGRGPRGRRISSSSRRTSSAGTTTSTRSAAPRPATPSRAACRSASARRRGKPFRRNPSTTRPCPSR